MSDKYNIATESDLIANVWKLVDFISCVNFESLCFVYFVFLLILQNSGIIYFIKLFMFVLNIDSSSRGTKWSHPI